jgi:hypothetical protein
LAGEVEVGKHRCVLEEAGVENSSSIDFTL